MPPRRLGGFLLLALACEGPTPAPAPVAPELAAPPPLPTWPEAGSPLRVLPPPAPPGRRLRVVVDAGHGAPGNEGNTSVRCEKEQDFTRRVQDEVVKRLADAPELEVRAGRPDVSLVDYGSRISTFNEWNADAVVSLHSDARAGFGVEVHPVTGCWSALGASGFSILYSDEGAAPLARRRERLAREMALAMSAAGFGTYALGYSDESYAEVAPGVFVDRHPKGKRIRMLRGTAVPTIIVETHQAFDPDEAERWTEAGTLDAFAAAVRAAVVATTRPE